MIDTLDLLGVIGTWVAVLLGLVALIGVITPMLILQAAHSDRSRALRKIDDAGTGYIKKLNITQQIEFRSVQVPTLNLAPGGEVKLLSIVNSVSLTQPGRERHLMNLPSSSTGWVNLANLAEYYSSGSKRGDPLLIRHQETWFPIHRFFVLAIGLRGRYGHRPDRGEARSVKTTARLFTEEGNRDDEDTYQNSPTANKLYGKTGVFWWRQNLDVNEARFDEINFAQHPDPPKLEDLFDPAPLSELFWLSIGCLPKGDGRGVFDLDRSTRIPVVSTQNNRGQRRRNQNIYIHFTKRNSLLTRHKEWAISMGIEGEEVFYLEFPPGMTTSGRQPRVIISDLHSIARGILKLRLSAGGFLLPAHQNLSSFFDPSRFRRVLAQSIYKDFLGIGPRPETELTSVLRRLADHVEEETVNGFSRQRAELCFEVDSFLQKTLNTQVPEPCQEAIGILTIVHVQSISRFFDLVCVGELEGTISITPDFNTLFESAHLLPSLDTALQKLHILLCCLKACTRIIAINNFVDSTPLLDCVNKMTATVHVASNTYPPMLHSQTSQHQSGSDRSSMTGSGIVFSDDSDEDDEDDEDDEGEEGEEGDDDDKDDEGDEGDKRNNGMNKKTATGNRALNTYPPMLQNQTSQHQSGSDRSSMTGSGGIVFSDDSDDVDDGKEHQKTSLPQE